MRETSQRWIWQRGIKVRLPAMVDIRLNALQQLLLYAAVSVWFMVYVVSQQRNYQDAWILDGIVWPFAALIAAFLLILATQKDNRIVALLCAWTILVITLIPTLKYAQPYGSSIDATDHYLMVQNLIANGQILSRHTYSSIPAMHSWLASLGIMAGLSETTTIQLGLPLSGAIMPLLVYWMVRRAELPAGLTKYTIAATCLSAFPYYLPNGTGFTLVPLVLLLGALLVREYRAFSQQARFAYTVVVLIALLQITFWHSTTPMLLPLILAGVALTPLVSWVAHSFKWPANGINAFLRMSLLALVLFVGYRMLVDDPVFRQLVSAGDELVAQTEPVRASVPQKLFEVTLIDAAVTTWLIHGRAMLLYVLTAFGVLVLWRHRSRFQAAVPFYTYLLLVFSVFVSLVVVSFATGVSYGRFLSTSVAFSPFFVGPFLWWLRSELLPKVFRQQAILAFASVSLASLLVTLVMIDFFSLQPVVPKAKALEPEAPGEYVVWLHAVNSAYQQRMMTFAETYTDPEARFATDVTGQKQFMRYFGSDAAQRRTLYLPLYRREAVDPKVVQYFLLHWPGPAGGLGEQVEYRSVPRIEELRETLGWGLIYDNGESFILWVR